MMDIMDQLGDLNAVVDMIKQLRNLVKILVIIMAFRLVLEVMKYIGDK